ncbi:MAG: tripartite tricarboxylate transporter permease, partial [Pseudomonadota bacterium]
QLITNNLDITYTVVWSLALANVVGAGLCILLSKPIAQLTTIRFALLAPFLFMMISFAAFQSSQSLSDLAAIFFIGVLGILLRRFDWSRPAFLIGFVLSTQAENFSFQAYQIAASRFRREFLDGMEYIFSPIVLVLIVLTVVSVVLGIRQAKQILPEGDVPVGHKRAPLLFLGFLLVYFIATFIDAYGIRTQTDRIFPLFVSFVGTLATLAILVRMLRAPETDAVFADREASGEDAEAPHGLWMTLGWFGLLLALAGVLGFILALAVYLVTFLRVRAGADWRLTLILSAAGIALLCTMAGVLNRDFPPGLLQDVVDLPWPLGRD